MGQKIYFQYKDDDKTDWLNRQYLGMLPSGLYRGFDYDGSNSTGATLVLWHSQTGYRETLADNTLSDRTGLVRTKHGANATENTPVSIPLTSNAVNVQPRIDLIVLEHTRVDIIGGVVASYVQILGTPAASPVAPALSNPNIQVILGQIAWPASEGDIDNATYTRATPPNFNNQGNIVYTDTEQVILASKDFRHFITPFVTLTMSTGSDTLTAITDSNKYVLLNTNPNYELIKTVVVPFTLDGINGATPNGNQFTITTDQKLYLQDKSVSGGNLVMPNGTTSMHVERGETITLFDLRGQQFPTGQANAATAFLVIKGNDVKKDLISKMFKAMVGNKAIATQDAPTNCILLNGKGNYYQLDYASNVNYDFKGITSFAGYGDTANDTNSDSGHFIVIKMNDTSGLAHRARFLNLASGLPAGFSNIETDIVTGQPFAVEHDGYVGLIEDSGSYRPIFLHDTRSNIFTITNLYLDPFQHIERIYDKSVSTGWKDLGVNPINGSNHLIITDDGNSFVATVPNGDAGGTIKDIKINRGGVISTCPNGMVIRVRFIHDTITWGVNQPFWIDLGGGNFISPLSESNRQTGSTGELWILDGYPDINGHVIEFTKTPTRWLITDVGSYVAEVYDNFNILVSTVQTLFNGAWLNPATYGGYTTDWIEYAPSPVRFRKQGAGNVKMKGSVRVNGAGVGTTVFTLPLGFRPQQDYSIIISTNSTSVEAANLKILTDGKVKVFTNNSIGTYVGFNFDLDAVDFSTT